ncbi:hypothetical protein ALC53_04598 [Atta colombica]|uniref:Uncharacterized protein n=1 Tax=Atta colombica TaxID=520822 RepID=A0A195BKW2_9HYME|nr:hypothetical protein ALC53_04598 [Atta colombica]
MKGRKYGTVVCEGGQSSGGHDGVYGERKRVDTSLKVERKYEKVKESETVLIKKVFETARRNREIARIPVNNGTINLTSFLKTDQIELKTSNQSFSDLDRAKLSAVVRRRGLCGYILWPSEFGVFQTSESALRNNKRKKIKGYEREINRVIWKQISGRPEEKNLMTLENEGRKITSYFREKEREINRLSL